MKYTFIATAGLILLFFSLYSQEIPKKSNTIQINNNKTAAENFILAGSTLIEKGIIIESKDKDFFTLKTEPSQLGKKNYKYTLNVVCKDNAIILRATYSAGSVYYGKVTYKGMGGSPAKVSFLELNKFASSLGTDKTYLTTY